MIELMVLNRTEIVYTALDTKNAQTTTPDGWTSKYDWKSRVVVDPGIDGGTRTSKKK